MGALAGCLQGRIVRLLLAAVGALALATPLSAKDYEPDCAAIDAFLEAAVDSGRTVGASALVWKNGAERCFEQAGQADRELGRAFQRDTLVQVFSMTKPVTGVALMQLWEQGRFALDDPLHLYLPEFAATEVLRGETPSGEPVTSPPKRPITVRDILRHTAGLTYGADDNPQNAADRMWRDIQPLAPQNTLEQAVAKIARVPLLHDPGTHWHYSSAVDVQARLVEVLSGQRFADYVATHILRPLKMHDSGWKRTAADRTRLARIYVTGGDGGLVPMDDTVWLEPNFMDYPLTMGGSGLVAPVDDYMRFARMLLGEGELDGVRILKPATIRLMATDQLDPVIAPQNRSWLVGKGNGGFGFDFFVRTGPPLAPDENRGTVGEFFWDGYPSMLFWVDPAQDMAVVFATQKVPFDNALHHDLRTAVYGADYPGVAPKP